MSITLTIRKTKLRMSNIETKDVNFNVRGKDGLVQVVNIQKHKPYFPMCFIRTVTGHMIFCQENHPVCIQMVDGQDAVVEAKDVVMFSDRIWVDNTHIKIPENQSIQKKYDDTKFRDFLTKLFQILIYDDNSVILSNPQYFLGDDITNFYINLEALSLLKIEYLELLITFASPYQNVENANKILKIKSFNLVSQLKLISEFYNCILIFEIVVNTDDDVAWAARIFKIDKEPSKNKVKDYVDIEQVISGIHGFQGYVYDLKTESEEFMNNNVQTHNSFHTGGAVEFKKIDILKELGLNIDSNEETHLKRLFNQVDNDLFCNNALTKITINKTLFQDEYAIKKDGEVYKLPLGYFVLNTGELRIDATIEQPIELSIPTDYSETATVIELVYGQGAKILHIKSFSISPEKIAQHLDSLVGGKSPYTTPESLLRKFHNDLEGFNNYDMTHLEVIVASVLRNKLDPMIPARLKEPYNPETFSIKALPGVISWSLGMAYENISKALSTGLISDDAKNLSQIEKVLYGEPLSELSLELLAEKRKKR